MPASPPVAAIGPLPASADEPRFPAVTPGFRIGLYGGSFNPAHEAHRQVSLLALRRLGLDQVWWLASPGNPLKDNSALPSLRERLALAGAVSRHPALLPTGIEVRLGTRYTRDTVAALVRRYPQVRFVWVMGADNLAGFHRWQRWRDIAGLVPIAVVDRPGATFPAMAARAAHALARWRIPERDASTLADRRPPAWVFLHGLKSPLSSTLIRATTHPGPAPRAALHGKAPLTVEK
ncbi:nicotinate-nucleotide adenylyltransferase [Ancylobacter sp. 6x-1]|uniref:Probable nicotinate-nucleotide adenylyltransferase n=1 Tax=Ancylobacter crimeensis TaxID=2579147 RepID=A0ABT0DD48_9HYPH|nr:nicotinate-nucleotide adenylyltransferase [Ancylobacter crimeensis]MCK0197870.1 nicotinate-nucleotide adenylyltransferase [Ancylobacter crimeensis]